MLFPALLYCHLLDVELRHNVDGLPKTTLYSTLTGKTTYYSLPCYTVTSSMLSLGTMSMECLDNGENHILFPALLYCDLLNVELRHNVDGVPRQVCHLRYESFSLIGGWYEISGVRSVM